MVGSILWRLDNNLCQRCHCVIPQLDIMQMLPEFASRIPRKKGCCLAQSVYVLGKCGGIDAGQRTH